MEHLTVYLIILGFGLVVTLVGFVTSLVVSVGLALTLSRLVHRLTPREILLVSTGLVPVAMLVMLGDSVLHIFTPEFRGPELLGIIIFAVGVAFMVILGWPVSYLLTRRILSLSS